MRSVSFSKRGKHLHTRSASACHAPSELQNVSITDPLLSDTFKTFKAETFEVVPSSLGSESEWRGRPRVPPAPAPAPPPPFLLVSLSYTHTLLSPSCSRALGLRLPGSCVAEGWGSLSCVRSLSLTLFSSHTHTLSLSVFLSLALSLHTYALSLSLCLSPSLSPHTHTLSVSPSLLAHSLTHSLSFTHTHTLRPSPQEVAENRTCASYSTKACTLPASGSTINPKPLD